MVLYVLINPLPRGVEEGVSYVMCVKYLPGQKPGEPGPPRAIRQARLNGWTWKTHPRTGKLVGDLEHFLCFHMLGMIIPID